MKRLILFLAAALCCANGFAKEPKRPETYNYQRGCELIADQQLDEGIDFLDKEIQQNPKNGYAYAWMASAKEQQGEYGTAIFCIGEALKNLPKSEHYYRAWAHSLQASIFLELGDTAIALSEYAAAIKQEPDNSDWYEKRGKLYGWMKEWDKSSADFEKCIALSPGLVRGHILLGRNYYQQERYEEALGKFSYADKLAHRSWTVSEMARAEAKLGRYEEAAEHAVEALKLEPFEETALKMMIACKNEEFTDLLRGKLRVQIKKNPNVPEWMLYLMYVDRNLERYEDAIRTAKQLKKIYPDASIDGMLADLYCDMGDWQQALHYQNEAMAADSTDASYRYTRCFIYYEMDSIAPMMADICKLLEENPESTKYYSTRAMMHFSQDRYEQAIEDFDTGLAIDPRDDHMRYNRGRCHEALGHTEKAQSDYLRTEQTAGSAECRLFAKTSLGKKDEAMQLADSLLKADSTEVLYNVACAYALMGEKELALNCLEKELSRGYVRFTYIRHDPDLRTLQGDELEQLLGKYEAIRDERIARFTEEDDEAPGEERIVEVPFTAAGGVTKVDCTINGLPLSFIFDTGASDVTISQTEANFMYKNGYLSPKDVIGTQRYQTADGNISIGTTFVINKINFGGLELSGVLASVVANQKAPLLLGQTVLQRLGKIEIDNEKKVLKITTKK